MTYKLHFDGACQYNGTPDARGGYGFTVFRGNEKIADGLGFSGEGDGITNNVAEYHGLLEGLKYIHKLQQQTGEQADVTVYGDSNMVINMASRKWGWKMKNGTRYHEPHDKHPHLLELLEEVFDITSKLNWVQYQWVRRDNNQVADELSKHGCDNVDGFAERDTVILEYERKMQGV